MYYTYIPQLRKKWFSEGVLTKKKIVNFEKQAKVFECLNLVAKAVKDSANLTVIDHLKLSHEY